MAFNTYGNKKYPCKRDCPLRTPYCHGTCKEYLIAKARDERENQEKRRLADVDSFVINSVIRSVNSNKRIYGHRSVE